MNTVDRQGIHIEQCDGCRGIFLDRGELEQIVTSENRYYDAQPVPAYQPEPGYPPPQQQPNQQDRGSWYRDSPPAYSDSPPAFGGLGGRGGYGGRRKKRSFLEELFD